MRRAWLFALALAVSAGCQSLPQIYDGAAEDAKFILGGKWDQKEMPKEEPKSTHEDLR
jgi:hypothetical protein